MITRDEVTASFDKYDIRLVPPGRLSEAVVNKGARRVLTEVGLPASVSEMIGTVPMDDGLSTASEVFAKVQGQPPSGAEGLFVFGFSGPCVLAIDGMSGEVVLIDERDARVVSGSLDVFVKVLCMVNRELTAVDDLELDESEYDNYMDVMSNRALDLLARCDPEIFERARADWETILKGIVAASA